MLSSNHLVRFIAHSCPALFLVAASIGCETNRRYEVVAPADSRGAVAPNAGAIVSRDKLDYEVFSTQGKVIVRFINRTGAPLELGEESVTFDSTGRPFAVEPQSIAPDQSGRVVLPPSDAAEKGPRPPVLNEVEVGGVDEGGLISPRRDRQHASGISATAAPEPGFRWRPGGVARLRLVFVGPNNVEFTHDWTLRRTE
jgi:hypothetical protein